MRYVLDAASMKNVDSYSINTLGIPSVVLMERAALSVTEAIESKVKEIYIQTLYAYVDVAIMGQMDLRWQDSFILRATMWMCI